MEGEIRGEGQSTLANTAEVSGWRGQWGTQASGLPGPWAPTQAVRAETLPRPQASGSPCQLSAKDRRLVSLLLSIMWDGKSTVPSS